MNKIMTPWQMAQIGMLKDSLAEMFTEEDSRMLERRIQGVDAKTYYNACIDDFENYFLKNYAEFKNDIDNEFYINILKVESLRHVACFSEKK